MKKTASITLMLLSLSACTADQVKSFGTDLLGSTGLLGTDAALLADAKRQTGLKSITETPTIDLAYFRANQAEILKLVQEREYYKIKGTLLGQYGMSFIQSAQKIATQGVVAERKKQNYQAPTSYATCVAYNRYFYDSGFDDHCASYEFIEYTKEERQKIAQQDKIIQNKNLENVRNQFNQQLKVNNSVGVYDKIPAIMDDAIKNLDILDKKLTTHCNKILKANTVEWVTVTHKKSATKLKANKNTSNCALAIQMSVNPNMLVTYEPYQRFSAEYEDLFRKTNLDIDTLISKYKIKNDIWY